MRLLFIHIVLFFVYIFNIDGQTNLIQNGSFREVDFNYYNSSNPHQPGYPKKLDSVFRYWYNPSDSSRIHYRYGFSTDPCPATFPFLLEQPQLRRGVGITNDLFNLFVNSETIIDSGIFFTRFNNANSCYDPADMNNMRSYATNLLNSKTKIGKHYRLSFFIFTFYISDTFYTDPAHPKYAQNNNGLASDGLGIAFTSYLPVQDRKHRLLIKPQWQTPTIINHKGWKQFTFDFVADSQYQYMTIGIFKKNKDLKVTKRVIYPFNQAIRDEQSFDETGFGYDSFTLFEIFTQPVITGPKKVCKNNTYIYGSGSGNNTKWFYKGDTIPFYIGDSINITFTQDTTLIAMNETLKSTLFIKAYSPPLQLLKDTFILSSQIINIKYPVSGFTYQWDNKKSDSLQFKTYSTKGTKFLRISNQACSIIDSFFIDSIHSFFKIKADTSVCNLSKYTITTSHPFRNYNWQFNSTALTTAKTIVLNYPVIGTQAITACYDTLGFTICDTTLVHVFEKPTSNLPKQISFCAKTDSKICLQFNIPNIQFKWQDGTASNCTNIQQQGQYIVFMQNGACFANDTLNAKELQVPQFDIVQRDTPCLDGSSFTVLRIQPDTFPSILWLPGGSASSQLTINDTNTQKITVTGSNGCMTALKYKPLNGCNMVFYVPNSFSPDNNGINDGFNVKGSFIGKINMRIYNTWGEMVFQTNDLNKGWDGTYQNAVCPQGNYLVIIELQSQTNQNNSKPTQYWKGMVQLLR